MSALLLAPVLRRAVARYAVPPESPWRTGCDGCGAAPAGGPSGRCPACRARVGAPPAAVELSLLAALAVLVAVDGGLAERAALAWWLGWMIPLVWVDLAVHRLPDRLTLPAAAGVVALLGLAAPAGDGSWPRALAAGAGLGLAFAGTTVLLGARGFGLGDAKLALSAGALLGWHGWPVLVAGVALAFAASGVVGLVLLAARRTRWSSSLPFGPFLVAGTVAALLLAG